MNRDLYQKEIAAFDFDLSFLRGKSLMLSGATGMIGSYLVDSIMEKEPTCRIIALGRNEAKARARFGGYFDRPNFVFYECDLCKPLELSERVDYVIHAASNTHPLAYSTDPIGTITANVLGLYHLLEYAAVHDVQRFVFLSSVEVYGENRGDTEYFDETYCGYLNSNTMRAGYPESKRVGETLCQAYIKQKGMDIVIPRLARVFGPTLLATDTKALSQFLHKGVAHEDIVLKSAGTQFFSYLYVEDAVTGILQCMRFGACGEAYNLSDPSCDISLRDLAGKIAQISGTKVVFELPDDVEKAGYSTATKAVLDCGKVNSIGWKAKYDIDEGLRKTLSMLE